MKSNGIKKAPGIMYFKDESEFPQVMRLSPFLTIHQNYKVYEDSVASITDGMRVSRVCCQSHIVWKKQRRVRAASNRVGAFGNPLRSTPAAQVPWWT